MRNVFFIFIVFTLLFTALPVSFVGAAAPTADERVIILFKNKVDKNIISKANGKIHREYKHVPAVTVSIPAVAMKGLQKNPTIAVIEPDSVVNVTQTQDWGITQTQAPTAWESGFTGKGVNIAVVDTGIAPHEDLVISGGASFTAYTTSYSDDNGHGTHAAGIIGARNNNFGTVGIAPEVNLYAVKALDSNGSGYLSDVIAGIDWSITNKMDIINLSLGSTSHSSTLQQVVDKAYNQGILVVAAAGNNGTIEGLEDTVNYPARYASAIAVAATDSSNNRASFSATGNTVEVAAPGVGIVSTYLGNRYVQMSGTSMATPYTAGNLALLKQANPTLTHAELRLKLQENLIDLGDSGKDNWFGHGLIQAPKLVQQDTSAEQQEPIVEEVSQVLQTMTSTTTNKTSYLAGEKVSIAVNVTDEAGEVLSGANVTVTITPPKGKVLRATGTTNQNGTVSFVMTTKTTTTKGIYHVKADTTMSNYENSSATTFFQIK
ncbi:S8 family serine peptidase [Bacillus solitudinis]|uniref:S8 family serine peptidase n=1 Tax=Bacillus solitudinis TaxID=2014074 RepID=UPI001D0D0D17|nr:S8 family serine peptidase [Bacillus solitudinis]